MSTPATNRCETPSTARMRAADRPIVLDRQSVEGCHLPPDRGHGGRPTWQLSGVSEEEYMASRISEICISCADPDAMAKFWSAAIGYRGVERDDTGVAIMGASNVPSILFLRTDDVGGAAEERPESTPPRPARRQTDRHQPRHTVLGRNGRSGGQRILRAPPKSPSRAEPFGPECIE